MSADYTPVLWNRQKRLYDGVLALLMAIFLTVFISLQLLIYPDITVETLIIRSTGTLAFLMLHVILMIGPLARIDGRFIPLLYNRRHLGVAMFLVAFTHGVFNLVQFHAFGDVNPLVALLTSNTHYTSLSLFPFQVLGFIALIILTFMAATSHDFWLKNLTPKIWKTLHMMVYLAYLLLLAHVLLGVIQLERSPILIFTLGLGAFMVTGLHIWAGIKNSITKTSKMAGPEVSEPFKYVCQIDEIRDNCAKTVIIQGENIAIFRYADKVSAVSNICRHQNGPLGEGKIVDGCITCPWHGYQYLPHNGQSPPPFTEKLETYDVMVWKNQVFVNPNPYAPGTERVPATIDANGALGKVKEMTYESR